MKKHGMPIHTAELVSAWGRIFGCWLFGFLGQEGVMKEATSRETVSALTLDLCSLSPFCGQEKQNTVLWS